MRKLVKAMDRLNKQINKRDSMGHDSAFVELGSDIELALKLKFAAAKMGFSAHVDSEYRWGLFIPARFSYATVVRW